MKYTFTPAHLLFAMNLYPRGIRALASDSGVSVTMLYGVASTAKGLTERTSKKLADAFNAHVPEEDKASLRRQAFGLDVFDDESWRKWHGIAKEFKAGTVRTP